MVLIAFRAPEQTRDLIDKLVEVKFGSDRSDVIRKSLMNTAMAEGVTADNV